MSFAAQKTTLALALAVVLSGRAAADVPIPDGLQPGDTYHLLFNSSTFTNALSSSIGYYNDFVQAAADAAGIGVSEGVTWRAIASTASIDARDNAVVGTSTPVYNTNTSGLQKLADGFSDMWDGSLDSFPAYTEYGIVNATDPWTGTASTGVGATGATLGDSSGAAWCGRPSLIDSRWVQFTEVSTFFSLPVYALSEELTVPFPDADFDADSDIDGNDFLVWQRGSSDPTELAAWQSQYGQAAASSGLATISVPEPCNAVLVAIGVMLIGLRRD